MKSLLILSVAFVTLYSGVFLLAAPEEEGWGGDPIAPIHAPFPMPEFVRPKFPDRVFSIQDHGAVGDGVMMNTVAFSRTITACADAGGGRVLVPAGRWRTGAIHLRSHIELHLTAGAEIIFSDKPDDYLPVVLVRAGGVELYNYSPFIYARDCVDVAINGPGKLNGNAEAWRPWQKRETKEISQLALKGIPVAQRIFGTPEAAIRPNFVVFMNCRNVLLEGFTIGGGANWTIHPVYCEGVIIRRVSVITDGPNNDGIDPDSCRNVLIEHCLFDTGDDCVVLKSGYNEDGWRVARPMENLVMRWCRSRRGHGGLVIGSEMSGDVRNVLVEDCDFDGTDRAVRIKSRRGRGGIVENIWAENLRVKDLKYEVMIINMDYSSDQNKSGTARPPHIHGVHVRNVTGGGVPVAIRLQGLEDSPIEDVSFENMTITSTQGVIANNVKRIIFTNVAVSPARGPVFVLGQVTDIRIQGAIAPAGTDVFLQLEGKDSGGVRLGKCDLSGAKIKFTIGADVRAGAVVLE